MEHLVSCLKKGLWMWGWEKKKGRHFNFVKKFGKDPFTGRCKVINSFIAIWSVVLSKLIMKQNCDSIAWNLVLIFLFVSSTCLSGIMMWMLHERDTRFVLSSTCFYIAILLCVCSTWSGLHFLKYGIHLLALWFCLIYCYSESSVFIDQR